MFNEKYGLKLGEFNNITGTERVNIDIILIFAVKSSEKNSTLLQRQSNNNFKILGLNCTPKKEYNPERQFFNIILFTTLYKL